MFQNKSVRFFPVFHVSLFSLLAIILEVWLLLPSVSYAHDEAQSPLEYYTNQLVQTLDLFQQSSGPEKAAYLKQLSDIAEARTNFLISRVALHPDIVFAQQIPDSILAQLPPSVVRLLPQSVEVTGVLRILASVNQNSQTPSKTIFMFRESAPPRRHYVVHFVASPQLSLLNHEVTFSGVSVGQHLVLAGASGGTSDSSLLASPPLSWTTGQKRVLYVIPRFSDVATDFISESTAAVIMNSVNNDFIKTSYGATSLVATITPPLMMPQPFSYYGGCSLGGALETDVEAAAANAGYLTGDYNLWVFPCQRGGGSGWIQSTPALVPGSDGSPSQNSSAEYITFHELGHNYGLLHAHSYNTKDGSALGQSIVDFSFGEYGDSLDVMGTSGSTYGYNTWAREYLQWLPSQYSRDVTSSGLYTLNPYNVSSISSGSVFSLKIPRTGDPEGRTYLISAYNGSSGLDRVNFRLPPWRLTDNASQLLFPAQADPSGFNYSQVQKDLYLGHTYSDSSSGIHITPVSSSASDITLAVNIGDFTANRPPVVSISQSASIVPINTPITFSGVATDPEGDPLVYEIKADKSKVPETVVNNPTITRSWSSTGSHKIEIAASDMKGGTSSAFAVVVVSNSGTIPPVLAYGPTAITLLPNFYGVTQDLSALAADGDEPEAGLTYVWSLQAGAAQAGTVIFGENNSNAAKHTSATFSNAGSYYLQVDVIDRSGNHLLAPGSSTPQPARLSVVVSQTPASFTLSSSSLAIATGTSVHLTSALNASVSTVDQFGNPLTSTPVIKWTVLEAGGPWIPLPYYPDPPSDQLYAGSHAGIYHVVGSYRNKQLTATINVTGNSYPYAVISASPTSGLAPLTVSFDGSSSYDIDGSIASYTWTFGDGTASATGAKVSHVYRLAGQYNATLYVTDNAGARTGAAVGIAVASSATPTPTPTPTPSPTPTLSPTPTATPTPAPTPTSTATPTATPMPTATAIPTPTASPTPAPTPTPTATPTEHVPAAPTNLTAALASSRRIDLSWTDNDNNESGFRIERRTSTGTTWSLLKTIVPANGTTFSDTSISRRKKYVYRVYAFNNVGKSGYSNEAAPISPLGSITQRRSKR